jgi:hypothetical protein
MGMGKSHTQLIYASEKLTRAIYLLAIGPDDVRSRLREAFDELHPIQSSLLPESIKKEYDWIFERLTRCEPRFERDSKLDATLYRMRKSSGVKIAKSIVELKWHIDELLESIST